jgi:hypothetical protein
MSRTKSASSFIQQQLTESHSVIEDMQYLVGKYPNGYEGTESRKPERDSV